MTASGRGPLDRARQALLEAKERVGEKDTPAHRQAVEEAQAHMDHLLDVLPLVSFSTPPLTSPLFPDVPGAQPPGTSVSSSPQEGQECPPGESSNEDEQ